MAQAARTYVLVHGAFHGGWCWQRLAPLLRAAGHTVYTPTQTGLGERRHLLSSAITMDLFVEDIAAVIEAEELDRIHLVGHSFGGGTVAGVADRMPQRLQRLVFLDAGIPEPGKSAFDRIPPDVRDARLRAAQESSGGLSIPVPSAASFGLAAQADIDWVQRRLTPHPLETYRTAVTLRNAPGNGVPTTFIRCTDPPYANIEASAAYAKSRADWQTLELRAGHDAMVSAPGPLADLLLALP